MKDPNAVRNAILAQTPRFAIAADPDANPIAVEATLDEVVKEIVGRMKLGLSVGLPARTAAGDRFTGMAILVTDQPAPPGVQTKNRVHLRIHIHSDLEAVGAEVTASFLAYALLSVVVQDFAANALEAGAKKVEATIEKFPVSAAAPVDQPT